MAHSAPMTKRKTPGKILARGRAVRIHGLEDALRAVAVAGELGVDVILISAPNAAASLGPAWFRNITETLEHSYPGVAIETVLDCGDSTGYALAALRAGVKRIQLGGKRSAVKKVEEIAAAYGARLARQPGRVLDPREYPNPEKALEEWLLKGKFH